MTDNINRILEREHIEAEITNILTSFEENSKNINFKRGIYLYGSPGCGKTYFVTQLLTKLGYDVIKYDAGDIRNKALIDTITSNNISNRNVLQMMARKVKKIAIVMDEIDGMNNGDKGGITALIKVIRQKKTKKQKLETITVNPVICIGNYYIDKKIKELMKVCNVFELKPPTENQMRQIFRLTDVHVPAAVPAAVAEAQEQILLNYVQGDMRKLMFVKDMFTGAKRPDLLTEDTIKNIFCVKSYNEDSKKITQSLLNRCPRMEEHNKYMNETDRTIVALLWHENIVDMLVDKPIEAAFPFYSRILKNMCYADYIDRITFQSQIWQFNEMSSLMKTFYNTRLYHETFPENTNKFRPAEVRFTKVLTKYSTEYNNILFIYNLCQELDIDKKDLIAMFQEIRLCNPENFNNKSEPTAEIERIFENYNITKLDIKRMYRYMDKNVKKETAIVGEDDDEDD